MSEQYRPLQSLVVDAVVRERLDRNPDLLVEMEGERVVVVFGEYTLETGGISQTAFMQVGQQVVGGLGPTREAAITGFPQRFVQPVLTAERTRQEVMERDNQKQ